MKKFKKIMAVVAAMAMTAAMSFASLAGTNDGSISVKKNFKGQTYKLYQIFDATTKLKDDGSLDAISYRLLDGKNDLKATVDGNEVDGAKWFDVTNGNVSGKSTLTETVLKSNDFRAWVEAYANNITPDKTATVDNDDNVKWDSLAEGYYFVTTTTGSLVTVDSIKPNQELEDKNTVPTVDKKITGAPSISADGKKALQQIGQNVEYTATVTVGKGSKNLVFHDKMTDGLSFNPDSVEVTGVDSDKYTIVKKPTDGDTLDVTFVDGIPENTEIKITYKAVITKEAVTSSQENDAKISYGDNNTYSEDHKTDVYNAEIAVVKYDGKKEDGKFLAGAGFKLKNDDGKFYKYDEKNKVVSWVDEKEADEHFSVAEGGKVPAFVGLANGTYTLTESTVPSGYNKAADTTVEIKSEDYTGDNLSLSKTVDVENIKGSTLPTTGGMGTTILYVAGAILVIAGAAVLVIKKRHEA